MTALNKLFNELKYVKHILFHPFNGFYELKYENKGGTPAAFVLLFFYYLSVVLRESVSSYLFSSDTSADFSLFLCLLRSVAPLLLFCTANWCLTLLLNGEGKMNQIFTALCYSIVPMVFNNIIYTVLSNAFSLNEALYLQLIYGICMIWTAFLILIAVMQTNQYTFSVSIAACLLSIVGIAILLLIILLCSDLIGQVVNFVVSIAKEISYR